MTQKNNKIFALLERRRNQLPFLFCTLDEIGYRGSIGCECKPKTTTVEGLGWFAPHTVDV